MPEPLAAEALQNTKRPTCGSLSLFDFEPGQYECSMGIFPVAGPNAQQQLLTQPLNSAAVGDVCHQLRVSFDPPGCGSGMCCSCAAGTMLSPWRTGREAAILPGRFACRTASTALHVSSKFDRQVTFSPAFLPGCGWQTPQLFWTRKDTERGCAFCVQSSFSCLSKFSVIQFSRVIRLKETLCGTKEYSSPFVHIQHTEKTRLTT